MIGSVTLSTDRPPQARSLRPLLRSAPARMLHDGTLTALIVVSVAVLSGLVSAGPLYSWATATGLLNQSLAALPELGPANARPMLEVTVSDPAPGSLPQIENLFTGVPHLQEPQTSLVANAWQAEKASGVEPYIRSTTTQRPALLYHRTGATAGLEIVEGTAGGPGLWLPVPLAEELQVGPGSTVQVGKDFPEPEPNSSEPPPPPETSTGLTVAGTYQTRPDGRTPLGPAFTNLSGGLPGGPDGLVPYLLIGDLPTISDALAEVEERTLLTLSAELSPAGRTPDHLREAAAAVTALQRQTEIPRSPAETLLRPQQDGSRVLSGLPALQEQTSEDAATARRQGRGVAYAGAALGLAALVLALQAVANRRRRETELLVGRGIPLSTTVLAATLELVLPAAVGAAIGLAGVCWAFSQFGPSPGLDTGAFSAAALCAVGVIGVTLLGSALITFSQALQISRRLSGLRTPGFGSQALALLTGATVLAVLATLTRARSQSFQDPLAPLLPILVLACGCTLLVRLVGLLSMRPRLVGRWPVRRRQGSVTHQMVLRGLRDTGVAVADLVVVLSIGIGVLAYGLVAAETVNRVAEDKAVVLAGAPSSAALQHSWLLGGGEGPTPDLEPGTTVVWRALGSFWDSQQQYDVLVVNPPALREAAGWGSGPELAAARAALAEFGEPTEASVTLDRRRQTPPPALLVGAPDAEIGDRAVLKSGVAEQQVQIRRRLDAFPGAPRPTVVLDARSFFPRLDPDLDPTVRTEADEYYDIEDNFKAWVWTRDSLSTLQDRLAQQQLPVRESLTLAQAGATPELLSSRWAASYQQLLGLAAAALAGLAMAVAVDRRVARAAPADLILQRFGIRRTRLLRLRARELAATSLAALVVLLGPLALMVTLMPRLIEPLPALAPGLVVQPPWRAVLLSLAVTVGITVIAAVVAVVRSSSIKPAEVLRDDN